MFQNLKTLKSLLVSKCKDYWPLIGQAEYYTALEDQSLIAVIVPWKGERHRICDHLS